MQRSAEHVVVSGAGAAGMAAAIAAARAGARVALLEAKTQPGGTVADALIHTLAGLFDSTGALLNGGLAQELAERLAGRDPAVKRRRLGRAWVLNVCPTVYQAAVRDWLAEEPNIEFFRATRLVRLARYGERISEAHAYGLAGAIKLKTAAIVDATGTAEAVRLLDPT